MLLNTIQFVMFRSKKNKSLFDFYPEHEPYTNIESLKRAIYKEGSVTVEHKELEALIDEYWEILHPLIRDYINSYVGIYNSLAASIEDLKSRLDSARRALTIEQENVQALSDEVRELKKSLANEATVRRDLESRLKDERSLMESHFQQEKKSLELIAQAKFPEGTDINTILKQISQQVGSSDDVKRLKQKISELEETLKTEREDNVRIQGELSQSFMEKMVRNDDIIRNLKERLGEE